MAETNAVMEALHYLIVSPTKAYKQWIWYGWVTTIAS